LPQSTREKLLAAMATHLLQKIRIRPPTANERVVHAAKRGGVTVKYVVDIMRLSTKP